MSNFKIKFAIASDFDQIYEFLDFHFHDGAEPIQLAHPHKDERMHPDKEFIKSCIDCGTTLKAFIGDALVGVLIAAKIDDHEHERNEKAARITDSKKSADVLKLLSYVDEKANYCRRLGIPEVLHIHIVSVHKDYLGQGIARKMFEFCIENGRQLKYRAITVDCTNYYTAKIAEKLDFKLVSIVTYDEYNVYIGEQLFVPIAPHTEIKSYALMLE
jgi:GNAT superfamily N-acetyltransferase